MFDKEIEAKQDVLRFMNNLHERVEWVLCKMY